MLVKDILDLTIRDVNFEAKTVREYLCSMLQTLWDKGMVFNLADYDGEEQRWWEPIARVLIEKGEILGQIIDDRVFIVKRTELDEYMLGIISSMCHNQYDEVS